MKRAGKNRFRGMPRRGSKYGARILTEDEIRWWYRTVRIIASGRRSVQRLWEGGR